MHFLLSFAPWVAFASIAGDGDWRVAALVGLALSVAVLLHRRRSGQPWDAVILEVSAAVCFVAATVLATVSPDSALRPYAPALALCWMALTAWGSLAVGHPFTLGIARQSAPVHLHTTPRFHRTNVVITFAWALGFTFSGTVALALMHEAPKATGALLAVKAAGVALPLAFTKWYAQRVRSRARATAASA